jgi:ssDNA-binding Zn-finger/Zn-ribbon topoisomerase 1
MDAEVARLLEAGKNSARNGDTAAARSYLTQVVERDPHNEQAWMWLSGVATEPEEQQICLENVLVINPYNAKARQGLEFLSSRTGIPTQAPPVPTEYTSPLSDLNFQGTIQSPFGNEHAPAVEFNVTPPPPQAEALPDFSGEFALPPWMEGGPAPDPLAGAGAGTVSGPLRPSGASESLAYDMFASTPPTSDANQADPWAGMGVSSDSLNIDWSKGMDPEPAPNGSNAGYDQQQAWGGLDMYQQANPGSGVDGNGMPAWSMDNVPGFQPLEPGSLGFGQTGATPFAETGQADAVSGDWQNGQSNPGGYGPMGPAGDFQLPTPSDLPGFDTSSQGQVKPWYAQSSQLSPGMLPDGSAMNGYGPENPDERTQHLASPKKDQVMVTCPNCSEKVPDTSLSCTRCGFSFFVNCPNCHELVDVIDAKADEVEPCPYCAKPIEKMKLGMTSADPTMSYISERPVKPDGVALEMKNYMREATRRRGGFTWSWVVDVMWLVAIVMMVWVLTQLPAWWHLTGQY